MSHQMNFLPSHYFMIFFFSIPFSLAVLKNIPIHHKILDKSEKIDMSSSRMTTAARCSGRRSRTVSETSVTSGGMPGTPGLEKKALSAVSEAPSGRYKRESESEMNVMFEIDEDFSDDDEYVQPEMSLFQWITDASAKPIDEYTKLCAKSLKSVSNNRQLLYIIYIYL